MTQPWPMVAVTVWNKASLAANFQSAAVSRLRLREFLLKAQTVGKVVAGDRDIEVLGALGALFQAEKPHIERARFFPAAQQAKQFGEVAQRVRDVQMVGAEDLLTYPRARR